MSQELVKLRGPNGVVVRVSRAKARVLETLGYRVFEAPPVPDFTPVRRARKTTRKQVE